MPIHFVSVARLRDHLIMTSTLDEESSVSALKAEAKKYCSGLTSTSQPRVTFRLLNGNLFVSVKNPIFAFCVTDMQFDPQLAFQLLDNVIAAFNTEYGGSVDSVEKEYVFIDFHSTLDAIRGKCIHRVADSQLGEVRRELSDVKQTMVDNVKSAVIRKEHLDEVGDLSENLTRNARVFQTDATNLNQMYYWRTYGRPALVISISGIVYFLVTLLLV
jgi:hypothetical protein